MTRRDWVWGAIVFALCCGVIAWIILDELAHPTPQPLAVETRPR